MNDGIIYHKIIFELLKDLFLRIASLYFSMSNRDSNSIDDSGKFMQSKNFLFIIFLSFATR
jgi:hypothetical protein